MATLDNESGETETRRNRRGYQSKLGQSDFAFTVASLFTHGRLERIDDNGTS